MLKTQHSAVVKTNNLRRQWTDSWFKAQSGSKAVLENWTKVLSS